MAKTGLRIHAWWKVKMLGLSLLWFCLLVIQGCTFVRISVRNVPVLFRRPSPVHKLNRTDVPHGTRLSATWIGHATVLIQMDDIFVLTDPVLTTTIGGSSKRLVEPGMDLQSIPPLDAVLISHRHMDHLSPASLKLLAGRIKTVIVPPDVKADLPKEPYRVVELPAWQSIDIKGLKISAVPVIHDGGRIIWDAAAHRKSFTGYVIQYHGMTVYFPGDTAFRPDVFTAVAKRFDSVDLALMPICPIAPAAEMSQHHMNPAQAVEAARLLNASMMAPVHFETFVNSLDQAADCRNDLQKVSAGSSGMPKIVMWRIGDSITVK